MFLRNRPGAFVTDRSAKRRFAILGALFILCAAALWLVPLLIDRVEGSREGPRLFSSLSDPATVSETPGRVMKEDTSARKALLAAALRDDESSNVLASNEHSLFLALSQVRAAEAKKLFQAVLLPAIKTSNEPGVLVECFALMHRWSIPETMTADERGDLAGMIVERMLAGQNRRLLQALTNGLVDLNGGLDARTADALGQSLAAKVIETNDAEAQFALASGFASVSSSVSSKMDAKAAGETAAKLIRAAAEARNPRRLSNLALAANKIEPFIDAAESGPLASALAARMAGEATPAALEPLSQMFEPLARQATPENSDRPADQLSNALVLSLHADTAVTILAPLRALAPKITNRKADELEELWIQRMESGPPAELIAVFAKAIGALRPAKDYEGDHARARQSLLNRMSREKNAADFSLLAAGLAALGDGAKALAGEELVERMIAERDPHALAVYAGALDILKTDSLQVKIATPNSEGQVARLLARLREEPSSSALLVFPMAWRALLPAVSPAAQNAGAKAVAARIDAEGDAEILRALAFNLACFTKASAANFEQAESRLARQAGVQLKPEALELLAFGLYGLRGHPAKEQMESAARSVILHMTAAHSNEELRPLVSALGALREAGVNSFLSAAPILIENLLARPDANSMRSVAAELHGLSDQDADDDDDAKAAKGETVIAPKKTDDDDDASPGAGTAESGAAELRDSVEKVVARIEQESQPDVRRALGEALAAFPAGSLTQVQLDRLHPVFEIANAPCQLAALGPEPGRLRAVARQLLNPRCSDESWIGLAGVLGKMTKQPVVTGTADKGHDDDNGPDYDGLSILHDDDGQPADSGDAVPQSVDFNRLSQALDRFRANSDAALEPLRMAGAIFLLVLGVYCFYRNRAVTTAAGEPSVSTAT